MKIDEACINNNVMNIIQDETNYLLETGDKEERDGLVNYISGVMDLANKLKEVLQQ